MISAVADDYRKYIDKKKSTLEKKVFIKGTPQKYIEQYQKEQEDFKKGIRY